jgi:hypothetical protein
MFKNSLKKIKNKILFKLFIYYQIILLYYRNSYNFLSKLLYNAKNTISFKF